MEKAGPERFQRPRPATGMPPAQQADLLRDYLAFYEEAASQNPSLLNRKMDRKAAADVLNRVGVLISAEACKLADTPGPLKDFLDANPLPASMTDHLPPEFRAYCPRSWGGLRRNRPPPTRRSWAREPATRSGTPVCGA